MPCLKPPSSRPGQSCHSVYRTLMSFSEGCDRVEPPDARSMHWTQSWTNKGFGGTHSPRLASQLQDSECGSEKSGSVRGAGGGGAGVLVSGEPDGAGVAR